MAARFELKRAAGGLFRFNLIAGNNEVILTSETYVAKASAVNGIASVRTNAPVDTRYERRTSRTDQPYFVLRAVNGEILGTSEMYSSSQAMEHGIDAVKRESPDAPLQDLT